MTVRTPAQQVCRGCSSTLDVDASWCWLCHRSTTEAEPPVPVAGTESPARAVSSSRAVPGVLRKDLSNRAALLLAAVVVAVVAPTAALLLAPAVDDGGRAEPAGVLLGGEQVDDDDLDRPAGP